MIVQVLCGVMLVLLVVDGQVIVLFVICDLLCEDSVDVLVCLYWQGYWLVMFIGDNFIIVKVIVKEVGIDEVIVGVLLDGKVDVIKCLQSQGYKVVMVGDGINDVLVLVQVDVGIVMGGGSDVVIEIVVIILMCYSFYGVVDVLVILKVMLCNMKQNLLGVFVYNLLGILIVVGIFWLLIGILFNLVVVGVVMVLLLIIVVSNVNCLLCFKLKE